MQVITAGINATKEFFTLKDRNKILALLIGFLGLSVFIGYKIAMFSLGMTQDMLTRQAEEIKELKSDKKELRIENKGLYIELHDCNRMNNGIYDSIVRGNQAKINEKTHKR